jgi:hypothetical protein
MTTETFPTMHRFNMRFFIMLSALLCTTSVASADNGHLISVTKTKDFNVALFAEPWPARVGELQFQFIITDMQGNLVTDTSVLTMPTPDINTPNMTSQDMISPDINFLDMISPDINFLDMSSPNRLTLENTGVFSLQFAIQGIVQPPITIEVLPKASLLRTYWQIWFFLVFGLIFIILREKLAKNHARRYPSI